MRAQSFFKKQYNKNEMKDCMEDGKNEFIRTY